MTREQKFRELFQALTPNQQSLLRRYYQIEQGEQGTHSRKALCEELGIPMNALRIRVYRLRKRLELELDRELQKIERRRNEIPEKLGAGDFERPAITSLAEEPNPVSPTPVSTQPTHRQTPPLDNLRHLLQTRFPVLYAQVLEPTLADLRQEHSDALAEGRPLKARRVLLQGYGALAAAALCHLGFSLLGSIAALWQARSPK